MANKTATAKVTTTYTGPDNEQVVMPVVTVTAPYQSQLHAAVDVIDTLVGATDIALPFGPVGIEATMLIVENRTKNGANPGQRLKLTLNAGAGQVVADIAIGESFVWAIGSTPANVTTPILNAKVTTTDVQAGAGIVSYHVFGDPVA